MQYDLATLYTQKKKKSCIFYIDANFPLKLVFFLQVCFHFIGVIDSVILIIMGMNLPKAKGDSYVVISEFFVNIVYRDFVSIFDI